MTEPMSPAQLASMNADWQQVVLNGGPPCFYVEGDRFCFRALRWLGHDQDYAGHAREHRYASLRNLLDGQRSIDLAAAKREACEELMRELCSLDTETAWKRIEHFRAAFAERETGK